MKNKRKFLKARKGTLIPLAITYILLAFTIFGFSYDIANILYHKVYLGNLASTISMSMTNQCYYYGVGYQWVAPGLNGEDGYFKMGSYDPATMNVIVMPDPNSVEGIDAGSQNNVIGTTTSGITVTSANIYDVYNTQKDVRDGKTRYANMDFFEEIVAKQSLRDEGFGMSDIMRNQPKEIKTYSPGAFTSNVSSGSKFLQSDGSRAAFVLDLKESKINRGYNELPDEEKKSYDYIYYDKVNYFNRFLHGRDEHNGECEIYLVGYVRLLFIDTTPFDMSGSSQIRIDTYTISQPRYLQYDTEAITGVGQYSENVSLMQDFSK